MLFIDVLMVCGGGVDEKRCVYFQWRESFVFFAYIYPVWSDGFKSLIRYAREIKYNYI